MALADSLIRNYTISDELFSQLREHYDEPTLIEMTTGRLVHRRGTRVSLAVLSRHRLADWVKVVGVGAVLMRGAADS